jgi:hypothetical protein
MFYAGVNQFLTDDAPLTAVLATAPWPVLVPESSAYPCLSYQVVSGSEQCTLDGKSAQRKRVQFDAWAKRYAECEAIVLALRNLFSCFTGTLSDGTRVLSTFKINEIDDWGFDGRCYRITVEYGFHIVEA